MRLRERLRKLERLGEAALLSVPQRDGSEARFEPGALGEAFANLSARLGAGEEAPPEHPLLRAARNSDDPGWSGSFFAAEPEGWTDAVEDLSE